MSRFKKTHMLKADRVETEVQLGNAAISLRNAELGIRYANEQVKVYKVAEQRQRAFERAEQRLRESSDSSKTLLPRSSSSELTVANPAPLEQPINNIIQTREVIGSELYRANVYHEAAKLILQDKLTPTALVRDLNSKSSEMDKKRADLTREDQQIDNFLSSHRHPLYRLTGGRQEKE